MVKSCASFIDVSIIFVKKYNQIQDTINERFDIYILL